MNIDKTIINKCAKGDDASTALLYRQLYSCMMAICMRYQKNEDDAKEVMNSGFLKVIVSLHKYDRERPFIAWVRRIMININIDIYRKRKRERDHRNELEREMKVDSMTYNEADLIFDADELLEMIRMLPDASRNVFNLFAIDGYSHQEISEQLGMSIGTSKWHVSNARKKIIALMQVQSNDKNVAI